MSESTMILAQNGAPNNTVSDGDSWDLETFFNNATSYGEVAGGAFLALIGMAGLVWGGFLLFKKLMSEQSRESWLKIVALIILGGSMVFGGIAIILNFARGGQETIENFGNNGVILLSQISWLMPGGLG